MESGQTYKNHPRVVPAFHFFVLGMLLLNVIWSIYQFRYGVTAATVVALLVAVALLTFAITARTMITRVQDRVIRLEMRLRLKELLPASMHGDIMRLTAPQLIALRFASDSEMPSLCREVLEGKLASSKEIKTRIQNWQGDYLRA